MNTPDEPIALVMAADEVFAMPLTVTVQSVIESCLPDQKLHLYILDAGFSASSRDMLAVSLIGSGVQVTWLPIDLASFAGLPVMDHLPLAAYARLMMAELLPLSLDRVIYLDSDMLVRKNLNELWHTPMETALCLAVQDTAAPWLDSEIALSNIGRCREYLAAVRPVANYSELGLAGTAQYFNSGLLVVDLKKWRAMQVGQQLLECLWRYPEHALWLDQYALNVVLYGRWRPLDCRWNQGSHIYVYPRWQDSPFDRSSFRLLKRNPHIVHFTSCSKPWHLDNRHPWRSRYLKMLDLTAWAGWRPGTCRQRITILVKQFLSWIGLKSP